jgi:RNA-directed DNA polymerase
VPASPPSGPAPKATKIEKLRAAKTLEDLARLLGFTPSGLSYVIYKLPNPQKYHTFDIPKRKGGKRLISAPQPTLALLQRRLAKFLYGCLIELQQATPPWRSLAHGFEQKRSILTNAALHKRRRYVLNLDLKDFFPSINFGRVRGFFIKDKHFALQEKVATVIAQITCFNNELPQGSPCSPVISNLIGHLLDTRLARFAKIHKCTYSRYADDITFSTSRKDFPAELAALVAGSPSNWELGIPLRDKIEHSGFRINDTKTRMQLRGSRQVTTGLMVNAKVNIRQEYYRTARSMAHELFQRGSYYRMVPASLGSGAVTDPQMKEPAKGMAALEGILTHIYKVKDTADYRKPVDKKKDPNAPRELYARFLFYKNFVALNAPVILPEGKTDSVYLKAAIRYLPAYHPKLGKMTGTKFTNAVRFLNYSHTVRDVMQLGGGTGDMKFFIIRYSENAKKFKHAPFAHPVIMVIDNDDGAKDVFAVARNNGATGISWAAKDPFYHLSLNLYLVKTPEATTKPFYSTIEDAFDPALLKTPVGGKTFDRNKIHAAPGKYGKQVFAERVVKPSAPTTNLSGFNPLLDRIVAAIEHYAALTAAIAKPIPPAAAMV